MCVLEAAPSVPACVVDCGCLPQYQHPGMPFMWDSGGKCWLERELVLPSIGSCGQSNYVPAVQSSVLHVLLCTCVSVLSCMYFVLWWHFLY